MQKCCHNQDFFYKYILNSADDFSFFIYIAASLILTLVLYLLAWILSPKLTTFEKSTAYECGFEPYCSNSHTTFNIQYYIVAILFLIFDLEIIYILVWFLYLSILSIFSFFVMFFFLLLVCIGFIFEWKKGVLHWL